MTVGTVVGVVVGHVASRFTPGLPSRSVTVGVAVAGLVGAMAAWWRYEPVPLVAATMAGAFAVVAALCVVDACEKRLPDALTLPAAATFAAVTAVDAAMNDQWWPLTRTVTTAAGWALLLFMVFAVSPGFGFGDVKFGLLAGAIAGRAGAGAALLGLPVGIIAGGTFAVVRHLAGSRDREMPFGPAIAFGAVTAALFPAAFASFTGAPS